MTLLSLGEDKLGLVALRPASSKTLFKALQPRLMAANPAAKMEDQTAR